MPIFERDSIHLYYTDSAPAGAAEARYPVLLFAPGGMRSQVALWERSPWNPIAELGPRYRVIALDQRNAGRSRAPIRADDGWAVYTEDHLALLDHLHIERAHLIGGCIGGSYCLSLMRRAPERVSAAVLQQPIGFDGQNRAAFYEMFDSWAQEIAPQHPEAGPEDWASFRSNLYGADFVFSVDRDFVRRCALPMLVLLGSDLYHPEVTSREIARLAPSAELVEQWKTPECVGDAVKRVRSFLDQHTPL